MNHIEHSVETPSFRIGIFTTLRAFLCGRGSGAWSASRRIGLGLIGAAVPLLLSCAAIAAPPVTFAGPGSGAGQVDAPAAVAVDQSTGVVYVGEDSGHRVDEFNKEGHFVTAFGWGVADGITKALETCTATCFGGFQGPGPGEIRPSALVLDPVSHDVWISDFSNYRVEKFSSSGEFILMFGKGVDQGGGFPAHPGDVCKAEYIATGDKCGSGSPGAGVGQIGNFTAPITVDATGNVWVGDKKRLEQFTPEGAFASEVALPGAELIAGLALDTDPSSPSVGDFYTLTPPQNERDEIQHISTLAGGEYTLSFGGHTTKTIKQANEGEAATVQRDLEELASIGPGNINVVESSGGQVTEVSGGVDVIFTGALASTDVEQITASGGATVETTTQGKAGTPGSLSKLKPNGELVETIDSSGHPVALGLDPGSGAPFVSDQRGPTEGANFGSATLLSYDSSGAQTGSFGHGQVIGKPEGNVLAFGDSAKRLYVMSDAGAGLSSAQAFALPALGPLLREGGLFAKPVKTTNVTLNAVLTPEGAETKYHFEYIAEAAYQQNVKESLPSFSGATATAGASLPADFAEHTAATAIGGLTGETVYRFRVLAENSNGKGNTTGSEEATFTTLPPAVIDEEGASDVTATSATLVAQVNPLGNPTEVHFEYLTEAEYQANVAGRRDPFAGAAATSEVSLASSEEDQGVSQHVQGIAARTVYRYRAFAHNSGGPAAGPARGFTTQGSAAFRLPDSRQWEMVSPPDKHGAAVNSIREKGFIQAAAAGDAISYSASGATEDQPSGNSTGGEQILSRRTPSGWQTRDIGFPHSQALGKSGGENYRLFSPDLSRGLVDPPRLGFDALSPEATEATPYLRTDFLSGDPGAFCESACYRPLITAGNVPEGTVFGKPHAPVVRGATPDLSHVVLASSGAALTEAPVEHGLYEWAGGELQLVGVLPNEQPLIGVQLGAEDGSIRHAISSDGSRVAFSESGGNHHLYLRDLALGQTVQLDAVQGGSGKGSSVATFQTASADDSWVFFTDMQRLAADSGEAGTPDLYECEMLVEEGQLHCRLSDLTPRNGEESAALRGGVLGASEDGSDVYFVANGVLAHNQVDNGGGAETAQPGNCGDQLQPAGATCNLYMRHAGNTTFLAKLSGGDHPDWSVTLKVMTSRVSSDGTKLAFMSRRSLTGYDNRDAKTGAPDQEVFIFDASAKGGEGVLRCASCNPTSARPHGVLYGIGGRLAGEDRTWDATVSLAASIPGSTATEPENSGGSLTVQHQTLNLVDSGRVFFDSSDGLVPADTNGTEDVYQYEPSGVGGCTHSSPTFATASGGCIDLISSGASGEESAFLDASPSGNDVFFLTSSQLVPQDVDTALDLYDAHVCNSSAPCLPPGPPGPPACVGDACQSPGEAPNDPTPGSLIFHGPENLAPPAPASVSPKSLTRPQKLAKALKACKKIKAKSKRSRCQKQARKRFGGAKKARKATSNRGVK